SESIEEAKQALDNFILKWKSKYSNQMRKLGKLSNLFTFYEFPSSIRASIYSTNLIEAFNKKLKKKIRQKEQFPNEDALQRFVTTQILEYNDK
ncbi:transposase, partial [Limosilactobacillus mucosae]|uniref:transposase n=1 Tax=Limosilactobacillus mucosae TaxID=97478 RepID=UPI00102505CC